MDFLDAFFAGFLASLAGGDFLSAGIASPLLAVVPELPQWKRVPAAGHDGKDSIGLTPGGQPIYIGAGGVDSLILANFADKPVDFTSNPDIARALLETAATAE